MKLSLDDILYLIANEHQMNRTPNCPSDIELAQYFTNLLPEDRSKKLAEHISRCNYCSEEIRILSQLQQISYSEENEIEKQQPHISKAVERFKLKLKERKNFIIEVVENIIKVVKDSPLWKSVIDLQELIKQQVTPQYGIGFLTLPQNIIARETEVHGIKITMKVSVDKLNRVVLELLFLKDLFPVNGVKVKVGKEQSYVSTNGKVQVELPSSGNYDIEITLPDNNKFDFALLLKKH